MLKLVLDFADATQDPQHLQPPPIILAAESKVFTLLQSGFATFEDIGELLDCLPICQHATRSRQKCETGHPRQCTFSAGAYAFVHSTGIQLSTDRFPVVVQLLTSIMRGACPGVQFSSLTLRRNVQVQMHADKNNASRYESIIIPCGRWQGGSLWIQNSDGAHALDAHSGPGTMQRITWPYIRFSPLLRHATTPWTSGDRTILIG